MHICGDEIAAFMAAVPVAVTAYQRIKVWLSPARRVEGCCPAHQPQNGAAPEESSSPHLASNESAAQL